MRRDCSTECCPPLPVGCRGGGRGPGLAFWTLRHDPEHGIVTADAGSNLLIVLFGMTDLVKLGLADTKKEGREWVSDRHREMKKNVTKKLKENIKRWRILENPNYGLIVSQLHCYNFLLYFIIQELRKKLITEEKLMATQKLWVNDPNKHLQQKKKEKRCAASHAMQI